MIPEAVHELVEYEVECAYANGWRAALTAVAAGEVELGETWIPIGRKSYEDRIAERLALFERCAAEGHAKWGTSEWNGLENGAELRSKTAPGHQQPVRRAA